MKSKILKKQSTTTWAIGNGESRLALEVNSLIGRKIGCNAIHREISVDHLICVDRRMLNEAIDAGVNQILTKIYTRNDWFREQKNIRLVPDLPYAGSERWDDPWHWGAGPYAVLLSAKLSDEVNMIGFDLHGIDGKVNNVYKGTDNYSLPSKRQVDPRFWIYQISRIFKEFPNVRFTVYNLPDWQVPKAWKQPNVMVDNISNISYNV